MPSIEYDSMLKTRFASCATELCTVKAPSTNRERARLGVDVIGSAAVLSDVGSL
jgi:hypothetical protein